MAVATMGHSLGWRATVTVAARRLAAIAAAGVLLGLLVGGVGGRLAMMLLARLNPRAAGVTSDDGFTIGHFTLPGTLNLLVAGILLGALGAAIYAVCRPLLIGPRWFQVLSIGVGPAVVVGDQLVHVDGVDFRVLEPVELAIALFILIPGVYAALLTILAERWLAPEGFFAHGRLPVVLVPLLAFVPLAPLLVLIAAGWLAVEGVRRRLGGRLPGDTAVVLTARAALAVTFGFSLTQLVRETLVLT